MRTKRVCGFLLAFAVLASCVAPARSAPKQAGKAQQTKESTEGATREVYGKIESVKGNLVMIRTRAGEAVQVDTKAAQEGFRTAPLVVGRAVGVKGTMDKAGVLHAESIQRAKDSAAVWPADRP